MFLGIYTFLLGCLIFCQIILYRSVLWSFVFGVSCNASSFIYNFICLSPLSFFSVILAKGLFILFTFSKNQLLVPLIFPFFNWSIVDLQCCVSFRCTENDSVIYVFIYFHIIFHYRLLQYIEYSSLFYTVNPFCLSILCIVVCIC